MSKTIKLHKKHSQGYWIVYRPNHPHASCRGNIYEHREVMEEKLGRYLKKGEEVHHLNKIKTDNRPENLMLVNRLEHVRLERGWELIDGEWWKTCKICRIFMCINKENFYFYRNESYDRPLNFCKPCWTLVANKKIKLKEILYKNV